MKRYVLCLFALCCIVSVQAQVKKKAATKKNGTVKAVQATTKPQTSKPQQTTTAIKKTESNMNNFKKADWINSTDVYEVNLRQYTKPGTFSAFANELPRLKEMGVSTLWFMPVTPIAQKNKKGSMGSQYACSDYVSVNLEFGTLDEFKILINNAHDMGFKIIIDWVANHTGWDHVWTKTHPDYYEKDPATHDFKIASGMDDIIELDYKNPAMRKAMIDAMKYWITECNIDGFRCDLASWVELDFWIEARTELEKTKTLFWLAECDGIENADYYKAFDACYSWKWMHQTEDFYKKGQPLDGLKDLLLQYDKAGDGQAMKLWFTTNHDENSWNGTEYEKYGDAAKALAVFSFTWNGLPLIYSGQEMPNLKRLEFFEKDPISWSGNYELQDFYKRLLQLRKNPALRAADNAVKTYLLHTGNDNNILGYLRRNGKNEVLVLLNLSASDTEFYINDPVIRGSFVNVFEKEVADFGNEKKEEQVETSPTSKTQGVKAGESKLFTLKPWSFLVYEKRYDDK